MNLMLMQDSMPSSDWNIELFSFRGNCYNKMAMKVLSIRQPWAWLIVQGYKDVENRTWRTEFRGEFLVHAGYIFDEKGYDRVVEEMEIVLPEKDAFDRGGVIGAAEIIDCVRKYSSPWFFGPYGFILRNPRPLPFVPMKGKPGFFEKEI